MIGSYGDDDGGGGGGDLNFGAASNCSLAEAVAMVQNAGSVAEALGLRGGQGEGTVVDSGQ